MNQPFFSSHRAVRFQDIDAAGIIFFAKTFEFFHDAYVECLQHHGVELSQVLASNTWIAPIVHAESDYKHPMRFGDHLVVEISGAQLKERSMTVEYTIRNAEKTSATGKTAHAFIDKTSMRPCSIPPEIRAIFEQKS
jgi:1,4-dihydroxy-2-naphthoyl-CoA hydrolase